MADQVLRDKVGRTLGTIKTHPDGKLELKNKEGYTKGFYNPKKNETTDKEGRKVAGGNMLTTLL